MSFEELNQGHISNFKFWHKIFLLCPRKLFSKLTISFVIISSVCFSTPLVAGGLDDALTISKERMQEFEQVLSEIMATNVVTRKRLRTFVGKAQSIAGILYIWRPFSTAAWMARLVCFYNIKDDAMTIAELYYPCIRKEYYDITKCNFRYVENLFVEI